MSVAGAVAYYAQALQTGWDVDDIAARVQETKEQIYYDLTAPGLDAFEGVKGLILTAKDLGMVIGIGSSGLLFSVHKLLDTPGTSLIWHFQYCC
jgi:hypothetical protein